MEYKFFDVHPLYNSEPKKEKHGKQTGVIWMGGKYHNLRATLQSGQGSIFETISNLCFVYKNEEKAADSCRFLRPEIMNLEIMNYNV